MPSQDVTVSDRAELPSYLDAGNLRVFVDQAPVSMAMFDNEMRYIAASQRWIERLCGGTPDVIGRSHYEINPEIPQHWKEFHRRAMAGETLCEEREQLQHQDGSARWIRWQASPWYRADGDIGGITVVGEDVTAEVAREQALQQTTRALSKLHDVGWRLRLASDLREGLDEMLVATIELLGGSMGQVHILDGDGETLRLATQYGFTPDVPEALHKICAADDTAAGRALRTRMPVVVADTESDNAYTAFRSVAREAAYRAVVEAPLIGRYGTPLGMISTHFRAPHRPSNDDLQQLELYRRRAADFIERFKADEALREIDAKLAAETKATAKFYDLGLKVLQAQSLREALEVMISGSVDMLGADMSIIQLLDGEKKLLRVAAQQGFGEGLPESYFELDGEDDTARGRALRSGQAVVIENIELDEAYAPFRSLARKAGYSAIIAAPLIGKYGALQGILSLHFRSPHRPSDTDMRRLELFQRRGGDFIERFRAEDALRESNAKLLAETKAMAQFCEAGLRLWEGKSLQEGLDATLAGTIDLLRADMGAVQLLDRASDSLRIAAHRGLNREFLDFFQEMSVAQDGAFGQALRSGKVMVIGDTERDGAAQFRSIRRIAGYRALVAAPLVDSSGTLLGMLSAHFRAPYRPSESELQWLELYRRSAADFIQRVRTQEALRESEERLRLAVIVSRMGMFDWDLRTDTFLWSAECYRMLGYQVGEVEPSQAAWMERIHPEDRAAAEAAETKARLEHKEFVSEYRVVRRDGSIRWIQAHGRFFYHAGKPARMIGLKQDITDARQQIETQRVLVAELQHRTRNLMAVVQSIAHQTLDTVDSLAEFEGRFNRRLEALSRVQSLLSRADHEPITLGALVVMEFEALGLDAFDGKITFAGPEARLRKSAVEMLALAIHELLTNAIKYGALASDTGRLSVNWHIEGNPPDQRLALDWIEHGIAAPPSDPKRIGYGRKLIEEALPYSLSAETIFDLGGDGLRCRISLPLTTNSGVR